MAPIDLALAARYVMTHRVIGHSSEECGINRDSNNHKRGGQRGVRESEHEPPWTLIVGASGVVFGDIGTSPLYAFRETFAERHPIAVEPASILGVLSLIF